MPADQAPRARKLNAPAMLSSRGRDREFKAESKYVRLAITTCKAVFAEVALAGYTPQAWEKIQRRIAEAAARASEKPRQTHRTHQRGRLLATGSPRSCQPNAP